LQELKGALTETFKAAFKGRFKGLLLRYNLSLVVVVVVVRLLSFSNTPNQPFSDAPLAQSLQRSTRGQGHAGTAARTACSTLPSSKNWYYVVCSHASLLESISLKTALAGR
jgi:hypothetical protein